MLDSMRGLAGKVLNTVRTEGLGSLAERSGRFLVYRIRRMAMGKREEVERWRALKDRYRGRRVFLIGNGPSLNQTPLYLLGDEYTMCFNRWDLMLERLCWRPTFYTTIDDRVLLDTVDIVNQLTDESEYAFYPDIHPYNVDFRNLIVRKPNVYWLFLDRASFSDRLPYCGINKTVANVGLQVLSFLGFRQIYMLGVDMHYSIPARALRENVRDIVATEDDDDSHFDPRYFGKGRKFHVPMLDETFAKFREARAFFDARGVEVYNATVGGCLEEFPRVRLQDVLGASAARERSEFLRCVRQRVRHEVVGEIEEVLVSPPLALGAVPSGVRMFRVSSSDVGDFIKRHIYDFVPFGPFDNTHLFIARSVVRPPVVSGSPTVHGS